MNATLHIGLVVNPLAGLGGSLGLKGSDGPLLRSRLGEFSAQQRHRARDRVERALRPLTEAGQTVRFSTWGGEMGADVLASLDLPHEALGWVSGEISAADDTRRAVRAFCHRSVDLILFAGGDGTARDIFDEVGTSIPVLGIPAGVKMHSGVFAVSPEAAGELLLQLVRGGLVGLVPREVRDIDEDAFRHDQVRSRFYGELMVPGEGRYLQHTKVGGRESAELVADDIAEWLVERMEAGRTYLVGPGSTTAAIMAKLGLPGTLLGVDVVRDGELLAADADEARLLELLDAARGGASIVVTVIGGQGHIFGRGNQQFSPGVIRRVGLENIIVVAAKSKIAALEGRPLLVDTNDPALDSELCGWRTIVTGFDDRILYRIARIE